MKPNSKEDYFQGLVDSDHGTVHTLYKEYLPRVTRWVSQNSGSESDAFDIFQDTLEVLVNKAVSGTINSEIPFDGYFFRIVRNKWISKLREKNKEEKVRMSELERFTDESFDEHFEIENDNQQKVKQMLSVTFSDLSPLCQQLIPLAQDQIPAKEIAEELGMTNANAVHRRKFACFEAWKKRIQKHAYYSIWKKIRLG